jgi:hypothetical protein
MASYPGRQLVYLRTLLPRDVWEKDTLMAKELEELRKE